MFPLVHHHDHSHEEHHHDAHAFDPIDHCHNAIYHGLTSQDCKDHQHATASDDECLACHFNFGQNGQELFIPQSQILLSKQTIQLAHYYSAQSISTSPRLARGPPVFE